MKNIYCLYCGNTLEVLENQKNVICKNCRNEYTLNIKDDYELQVLINACVYYKNNDFKNAENSFEKICNENPLNFYAWWGCFLAYTHSKFYYDNKGEICLETDKIFKGELYANYYYRQALNTASFNEKNMYIKLCSMINNYNKNLDFSNFNNNLNTANKNFFNNQIFNIDKENENCLEKNKIINTSANNILINNNNNNDIEKIYNINIQLYKNALNKKDFMSSIDFFKSNIYYKDCKKYVDCYKDEWNQRLYDLGEIINKYFIEVLLNSKLSIIQDEIKDINNKLSFLEKNKEKENIYKNEKTKINSRIDEIKSELTKTSSFNFGKKAKIEKEKNSLINLVTVIEMKIKECISKQDIDIEVNSKRKLAELMQEKSKISTLIQDYNLNTNYDKDILNNPRYISVFNDFISNDEDLYIYTKSILLDVVCKNEDILYRIASNEKLLKVLVCEPKLLALLPQELQLSLCKRLVLGRYKQYLNEEETPIVWQIIKETSKYYYLMSEKILDIKPCNKNLNNNFLSENTLSFWLNNDFYNKAFNDDEKNKLQNVNIHIKDNSKLKSFNLSQYIDSIEDDIKLNYESINNILNTNSESNNTNNSGNANLEIEKNSNVVFDKVILVSFKNFINLSQQDKIAFVTEYVKSTYKTQNNVEWWIRKQKSSTEDNSIMIVDNIGRYTENYYNSDKIAGVRPCICIKK